MLLNGVEYVGGRNTGGASALEDLTDVNVSSITDGQILKYDSTTSKWVNDDESGGTVTDVQVNGTTVVDSNKVAQITSYKELTRAEYDLLPDTKYSDGIMYCISDGFDNANGFPPLIYSTEEREVGVWIDGKPLYQKSFSDISVSKRSWNTDIVLSSECNIVKIEGYYDTFNANSEFVSRFPFESDWEGGTGYFLAYMRTPYSICGYWNYGSDYTAKLSATLYYTKTTDTAGSGRWATDGGLAKHYSTSEQIIGTWIDGKPLYEKTIDCGTLPNNTAKSVLHYISNLEYVVEVHGTTQDESTKECLKIPHTQRNNAQSQIQIGVNTSEITIFTAADQRRFTKTYITVQYTKTTD